MGGLVISFFEMLLFCAIVIFIAFLVVWAIQYIFGISIDGNLMKWGKVIIGLICFIAFLTWVFSALGVGGVSFPHYFYQR